MIWSKIKHILLTGLIGLSLFLSFQIWTTGVAVRGSSSCPVQEDPVPAQLDESLRQFEVFSPKKNHSGTGRI
ncbi:MAG: hypothetical protein U5K84_13360 [Alkalibacterium sp.]|nr:hypothetical protein [Alkalibacterium sp.]